VGVALVSTKTVHGQLANEVLIDQVARGDVIAFETLYDRYAPTVLGIALKITGDRTLAEDILLETFLQVWRSASTYQSQQEAFLSWLFRIARNLGIEARRRLVSPPTHVELYVVNQDQSDLDAKQVQSILAELPHEQRQVIEMAYFYGMTRQEIAEATGKTLGTIHTDARLGLEKLRERLRERS
jgi:RNA polymerase sigma-70 factor (ECF subfamily)